MMPARMPTTTRTTRPTVLLFRVRLDQRPAPRSRPILLRRRGALLDATLIEAERRVLVAHEEHVGPDSGDPAVEPDDEVEDPSRIAAREYEGESREEHENPDQAGLEPDAPEPVVDPRGRVAPAAEEDPDDDVVRDREQPPLHEHEAAREALGVLDVESRRVVGHVVERERRIAVRAERAVGVERDAPRPAEHSDVEVEDPARVAARDEDREERDDREHEEREPQEREHDVVRDREEPLHEPEPAADARRRARLRSARGTPDARPRPAL